MALLPILFCHVDVVAIEKVLDNGTTVQLVDQIESHYGNVKVVDYRYGAKHHREVIIDGLIQGGVDMRNGLSTHPYPYLLQFLPLAFNDQGRNCLVIGLGAGVIPTWYESRGIKTDSIDINSDIVAVAKKYFNFAYGDSVAVEDARYFLSRPGSEYDYIILDVFSGDTTPSHIMSRESFRLIENRLSDDGILAVNLFLSLKKETFMSASVLRTIESVFDNVHLFPMFDPSEGDGIGNVEVIAYNGERKEFVKPNLTQLRVHPFAHSEVKASFEQEYVLPEDTPAVILTDEYNPIDCSDLWLKERIREKVLQTTDIDILLGYTPISPFSKQIS